MTEARVMWMRGGTSKGGFFLAEDLPADRADRNAFLLAAMGSPDPRQIDGMGGADPLTSKVAVIRKSGRSGVDVDYLFLQVAVDEARVTDQQNCGNMLSGVGPFAIERGLVAARDGETPVTIFMENTGQVAVANVQTPARQVTYRGDARIDGVPGCHAPLTLEFRDIAGSMCGTLLPSGNAMDLIEGVDCTLIDNGMPCVIIRAKDLGATGYESREELESDKLLRLRDKIEAIRLVAGRMMGLEDVADKTVPKMILVAPPRNGGAITARAFIPHRAHASIGVFAAVSVATACMLESSVAHGLANCPDTARKLLSIEHASGEMTCILETDPNGEVRSAGLLRTANKLMDGVIFGGDNRSGSGVPM